ncbi:uncharacterized protein LOC142982648 [Anticarsia gemmatalis]|uniref:uncharacterized protein LOC142982648 n=1 Tax=Anticarsia gemmatalis TaxID=129554 RepID=UPI003F765BE4
MKALVLVLVMMYTWTVEGAEKENEVEPRGKGVAFALLSHFFYVVATKIIVLKIVYGGLFFALIYKGWNFMLWFIHYLKEREQRHAYIEDHSFDHFDHGHFDHDHDHGHFDHDHNHDHDYGSYSYDPQPYNYDKYGYGSDYKKRIYDADGSYAVKSS